jgi:hypothetical protein
MKKIVMAVFAAVLFLAGFSAQAQRNVNVHVHVHNNGFGNFGGHHVPNIWNAYIEDEKVYIELTGEDWNSGRTFSTAEMGTLPGSNEGAFTLTREAGAITFKGVFEGGKGHGFYKFTANPTFKAYLEEKGYKNLNNELMVHIFLTDINKAYFDFLKANGYPSISNQQLKDLAEQGLDRKVFDDYFALFKTENWGHQKLDKIVELREHGVNAKFVNSFRQMGFKETIPLDKAMELRDHGVSPEFITSIQKMGYAKITLERAVDLRDHGVSVDFINSIQEMGYKNITLEKAQELRDHGVSPDFIKSINALGFKDLTLDKAQELRDHGVSASFIKKIQDKGMKVNSLDEYIRLRDTGFKE